MRNRFILAGIVLYLLIGIGSTSPAFPEEPSVYDRIGQSTVLIRYYYSWTDIFRREYSGYTQCSGIIIGEHSIITVYHSAYRRPPGYFYAFFAADANTRFRQLTIQKYDAENDLLLLHSEKPIPIKAIQIAEKLQVGEELLFSGYNVAAFPKIRQTKYLYQTRWGIPIIPVYHGDSGGGVFNQQGELVGIIQVVYRLSSGQYTFQGYACFLETLRQFLQPSD